MPVNKVQIHLPYERPSEKNPNGIFQPRWYQLEALESPCRYKILVLPRRAGKSKTALNEQILQSQRAPGIFYYFLPTHRQAKQVVWDDLVKKHVPMELVDRMNESELAVYYKNGSIERFVGCDEPDAHRGINPIGVVFDEYSEMKESIWTSIIQPVLRENKGTCTFVFTPKGKNHSHRLYKMALDNKEWFTTLKSIDETKHIEEAEWEQAKASSPQAVIKQEYYCEFLDEAGAFFRRIKENTHGERKTFDPTHKYQIGVDLAKYNDWTVITIIDLYDNEVLEQDRFNQIDWNLQKARIEAAAFRYTSESHKPKIVIDATGLGDPIVDDLNKRNLNIEPFKFTKRSRQNLLDNLAILLEQDKIKIPNDSGLIDELESMRYEIGPQGNTKLEVPDGVTDDRIMSLAMACWEIPDRPIKKRDEMSYFKQTKEKFNPNSMFNKI